MSYLSKGLQPMTTGKMPRDLSSQEVKEFPQEVSTAKLKELEGLYDLGCFKRHPRNQSGKIIDSRWVITWKLIDGLVGSAA